MDIRNVGRTAALFRHGYFREYPQHVFEEEKQNPADQGVDAA